ncbi:hypothetical protein JHK86_048863 [Glycine max]|nr:hypothetical protein JHK86_048863 [Glycine max]
MRACTFDFIGAPEIIELAIYFFSLLKRIGVFAINPQVYYMEFEFLAYGGGSLYLRCR